MEGYTTILLGRLRCEEQRRLMENFADTVKELLALHQQQFDAAVHGDPGCTRFDQLIHMANEKKQELSMRICVTWKSIGAIDSIW